MTTSQTPPAHAGSRDFPPGPRGLPILGNIANVGSKDVLSQYVRMREEFGDIIHMKLGPMHTYVLSNPEDVHHVLVKNQKNYIKGIGYDGFRLLVGQGLVTSDGELWRQQRRLMQPSFTPKAITQFSDMMVEVTQQMLDRWQPVADRGGRLVMDAEMTQLTMSIISRAMFSIDLNEELTEVGAALQDAFAFIPARSMNPIVPLAVPLPAHRKFKRDLAIIEAFIAERIEEGRRHGDRENLLGILLRAQDEDTGRTMSEEQLRDEVVTLFFAGFETTARSLTWGWYEIARHPEVAGKLAEEAAQVLAGRRPTIADLYALEYSRRVVDETLRLYPPTALLARQNVEEDEIEGYLIPPMSMIILIPYLVHRYPGIWPDPERFDPDRFLPEAAADRPKSAYIPFAAGPRVCLGNSFALQEMVYAFSMVSGRYRLQMAMPEEIDLEFVGTTRPVKPLIMTIANRR